MDYEAIFEAIPTPVLILGRDLVIVAVNDAYLRDTQRTREELVGMHVFDAFPENPDDPEHTATRSLESSLRRVLRTGERDTIGMLKYDIPVAGEGGGFEERYWSPINTPVLDREGRVELIIHRVEDVTEFVRGHEEGGGARSPLSPRAEHMSADLYIRTRELQELNERLRQAHARERATALALQRAMLPAGSPEDHPYAAVRYRPAVGSLNVCGDWYELTELSEGRIAVAVGDVVGQGLEAACVMGQLRSALSAATRVVEGPANALEVLGLYARFVEGALAATAVQVVIDPRAHTVVYSCAGHPPPALLHADGRVELLDGATDPPLGARVEQHVPRPQADVHYTAGATLVLYTDGLIERRDEDIDVGLERLTAGLARHSGQGPEELADALLADLGVTGGPAADDTALVVIGL
ncbi:PP2C family protein-serine/threonine phosphatase [Streptomyces sp. NA02950]|uniref:PP2C family protein-serine/threonine phosphatase n=1 Tax=Streptomyces sp. NA02950 TaxID=2742137 RepID=UPI0020CAAB05|nr:SpoIIE family protein phosphatase [Streptomyces sp. NA02950]